MQRAIMATVVAVALAVVGCSADDGRAVDLTGLQEIADEVGGIVAVSDDDGSLHVAAGTAALTGEVLAPTDGFMIWSTTKMMTAVSVLQLVDRGVVELDEPIGSYVDFPTHPEMTLRQLLQHTSGLYDTDPHSCGTEEAAAFYKALAADPPRPPGSTPAQYSTPAFNLVSLVIEGATGEQAHDVQRASIFEPLGMDSTYYANIEDGPALFHDASKCEGVQHVVGTGGGLASTVSDIDRFLRATFEGDLLSSESKAELMRYDSSVFGYPYGLGNATVEHPDGRTLVGHWGTSGYEAGGMYEPGTGRTVVVLKTAGSFENTLWAVLDWADAQLTVQR